jgi:hypothetical protein
MHIFLIFLFLGIPSFLSLRLILPRAGMSVHWSFLGFFPVFALILFWIVSFKDWPLYKFENNTQKD